jgi:hypothetical protein
LSGSLFWKKKRREKKRTDTHIRFGYIETWSMVLKDQGTSLRIYPKLSVLIRKTAGSFENLENFTTNSYFILKKTHLKLFKNLELEVISKSKNHQPQLHWHGLWTPKSSST